MWLKSLFECFLKKRNYVRRPSEYTPIAEYVRLDNIARTAGVPYSRAVSVAKREGYHIISLNGKQRVKTSDAKVIHEILCNEKK